MISRPCILCFVFMMVGFMSTASQSAVGLMKQFIIIVVVIIVVVIVIIIVISVRGTPSTKVLCVILCYP